MNKFKLEDFTLASSIGPARLVKECLYPHMEALKARQIQTTQVEVSVFVKIVRDKIFVSILPK